MIITKNLSVASLQVDPRNGVLWVNAPNCVLRVGKINFRNILDVFSMVDVIGNEAIMMNDNTNQEHEELTKFMMDISNYLTFEIENNSRILDKEKFLERVITNIRYLVDSEYREG